MSLLKFAQIAMLGFHPLPLRGGVGVEGVPARLDQQDQAQPRSLKRPASFEQDCFFRPVLEDHASALKLAQSL